VGMKAAESERATAFRKELKGSWRREKVKEA
jgi:hypothetical protein